MDKKRIISVDGVKYNLDTGQQVKQAKVRRPLLPTPSHATDEASAAQEPELRPVKKPASTITHFDGIKPGAKKSEPLRLDQSAAPEAKKATPKAAESKPATIKVEPKKPDKPAASDEPTPKPPLHQPLDKAAISHPSLPMPTATTPPHRTVAPEVHVFLHPFVQRVNARMAFLATARALFNWRFWFVVALPYVIYVAYRLSQLSSNQILALVHRQLNALPYHLILGLGLFILVMVGISYYIGSQAAQILNAVKLKQIDHRLSSIRFFFSQSDAKLFRTLGARLLHLVLFWGSALVFGAGLWYINSSTQVYLETVKIPVLVVVGIIGTIWLMMLGMRWPIARSLIAATDQKAAQIERKSFSLSFGNFVKSLGIAAFWSLISILFLAAVIAIDWSLATYLTNDLSATIKIVLSLVGICLLAFLFSVYTTWSMVFWASAYRVLVSIGHKTHLSEYLQIENPSSKGKVTLAIMAVLFLLLVLAIGIVGYMYQDSAVAVAKSLSRKLPESFNNLVPRL